MTLALQIVFGAWILALGLWLGYLVFLAILSARICRRNGAAEPAPAMRLAVIIPAHDEEKLIGATVRSLTAAEYPAELRSVYVVADNCADQTAARAAEAGAVVWERHAPDARGKSQALLFALHELQKTAPPEAILFFDADGHISPEYLKRAARAFADGADVFQGACLVADSGRTWFTRLTSLGFVLRNFRQFPALARLGLALPLQGAALGLKPSALPLLNLSENTVTEDLEWAIRFFEHGLKVAFDSRATVLTYMPPTPRAALEQRTRWSSGAHQLKPKLRALLKRSLGRADWRGLLSGLYLQAPPMSSFLPLAGLAALAGIGLTLLGSGWAPAAIGILALGGYMAYVFSSFAVTGFSWRDISAVAMIPYYAAWRLGVHARAAMNRLGKKMPWQRTPRV